MGSDNRHIQIDASQKKGACQFAFCASTGRTATMFIAQTVNELPNVVGLHEGQILSGSSLSPCLPLNLSKIEESMIFSTDDDEMDDYQTFFGLYFTQLVISWMWLRTRSTEPRIPSE